MNRTLRLPSQDRHSPQPASGPICDIRGDSVAIDAENREKPAKDCELERQRVDRRLPSLGLRSEDYASAPGAKVAAIAAQMP